MGSDLFVSTGTCAEVCPANHAYF